MCWPSGGREIVLFTGERPALVRDGLRAAETGG